MFVRRINARRHWKANYKLCCFIQVSLRAFIKTSNIFMKVTRITYKRLINKFAYAVK